MHLKRYTLSLSADGACTKQDLEHEVHAYRCPMDRNERLCTWSIADGCPPSYSAGTAREKGAKGADGAFGTTGSEPGDADTLETISRAAGGGAFERQQGEPKLEPHWLFGG